MGKTEKMIEEYIKSGKLLSYTTHSGIELKECYTAEDSPRMDELPGQYPFARGIHPNMYRGRIPTVRQGGGFDTSEASNERIKFLLKHGNTGLNVDGDMPTKVGLDPDNPFAYGDVGLVGASITTLEDMERLFKDIPLDKVSTTLIFPPPSSAVILAMYVLVARRQGIPENKLIGTIMNCYFTQMMGGSYDPTTRFFPIEAGVELGFDVTEYCTRHVPSFNTLNVNTYNIRECGVNAIQEVAFSLSIASEYVRGMLKRGLNVDDFAKRMAFGASIDSHFLEEIAKIRAMRRLWAKIMKEKFGAREPRSCWCRVSIGNSGKALTIQQPLNNIVRITIGALAAFLAGAQSMDLRSYDEAYGLPTEETQKLSIRVQQVIAYETDVAKTVDPLGGSYTIEALTNKIEDEAQSLMKVIEDKGGFIECFKQRWIEGQLDAAKYEWARRIEDGEDVVIGLNTLREEEESRIELFRHASGVAEQRKEYVIKYKKDRDQYKVSKALEKLYETAVKRPRVNQFMAIIDAVEAKATTGEIIDTLRKAENFELDL